MTILWVRHAGAPLAGIHLLLTGCDGLIWFSKWIPAKTTPG
jgi:hypothetical protein